MILRAARILVTVLSVTYWQQCLSGYTYEHPHFPFTQPDSTSGHTNQFPSEELTAAQCVARYATSEFRLQSPGFPVPYPIQLECLYIVEAVSTNICRLQANFITFDLGDCTSGDYVVIAGQRLCGNLSGTRTFRFSSPRSLILFRSGGVSGHKGFDVEIVQVPCPQLPAPNWGCSRDFSSRSVVLQSPGYPGPYPGDTRCQYVIRAATTSATGLLLCQAQFTFDTFRVDSSFGCTKDRLEIGDQEPVCGFLNGIRTYEFLGELHVDFYSDGIGNDGGFRIGVVQQQCRPLNVPDVGELPPPVLPPQHQPPVLQPQTQPPLLPQNLPPPLLTPQPQLQTLPPQPRPPLLPSQPPPPALQPTSHTSPLHRPLCCNHVHSARLLFIASPGFPFNNANNDVDCVYDIRPYSPSACGLTIIFKLFWVGQADGFGGCSGGFLEIDGRRYCDCIVGFTVVTLFDFWGGERRKILRYKQAGNVRNSGGFLLEILQEDCTDWSPRNWHDGNNVIDRRAGKDYNIFHYNNVGIGAYNMADGIALEENNNSDPYSRYERDWQSTAYFSKVRNRQGETVYADSDTVDRLVNDRRQTYRDEQNYNHNNTSVDESNASVTDKSKTWQLNPDPSDGGDMPVQNKYDIDTIQKVQGITTNREHNNTINNSDKNIEKFNYVHKCSSCSEGKHVGTYFSDNIKKPGSQNQDYNVFRGKTQAPFDAEKGKSHNNTKHCYNDSSTVDNSNASAVHLCRFDANSFPQNLVANGGCQSCTADCTSADRDAGICEGVTSTQTPEHRGMLQFKPPVRRNAVLSEVQAGGFWPLGQSVCGLWGFAQWFLQAKRYFWMLFPQLLCPVDSPPQTHSCQVLNQDRGWIQSPRYPQAYPNNVRWCYRFQRLPGYCHVQLFMLDFSIAPSEQCVKDYLLLGGQWRYCGESLYSRNVLLDMSAAPQMDVLLVSDSQHSGRGFRASYQHIPCHRREDERPADCGQVTDNEHFTLTNSGSNAHRSCVYRILRHSADFCGLRLNFTDFSLPCGAEYVQIDERMYCGDLTGRTIAVDFFKSEVRIVYSKIDPRSKGHFTIQGEQLRNCDFGLSEVPLARVFNSSTQCDIELSEVRGFVAFPPTHLSSSQPGACAYVIQPHKGMCAIRLAFGAFNVPSAANCLSSFMELHRRKFCNNHLEHRTTVIDFGGRTLRVPFHVEGSSGTYYWNFMYTQLPCPLANHMSGGTV